ncbi:hypothetical protein TNCV_425191 [Trichonephila clavipes]|nr:hypothetical protein TNCV_425191 [Trichonephila clavipes]
MFKKISSVKEFHRRGRSSVSKATVEQVRQSFQRSPKSTSETSHELQISQESLNPEEEHGPPIREQPTRHKTGGFGHRGDRDPKSNEYLSPVKPFHPDGGEGGRGVFDVAMDAVI